MPKYPFGRKFPSEWKLWSWQHCFTRYDLARPSTIIVISYIKLIKEKQDLLNSVLFSFRQSGESWGPTRFNIGRFWFLNGVFLLAVHNMNLSSSKLFNFPSVNVFKVLVLFLASDTGSPWKNLTPATLERFLAYSSSCLLLFCRCSITFLFSSTDKIHGLVLINRRSWTIWRLGYQSWYLVDLSGLNLAYE